MKQNLTETGLEDPSLHDNLDVVIDYIHHEFEAEEPAGSVYPTDAKEHHQENEDNDEEGEEEDEYAPTIVET